MNVFALDFDGVLCDSAAETAVTAWRAGVRIWSDWTGEQPPLEFKERFIRLRPVIETGYQTIPLMTLIRRGLDDSLIVSQFPLLVDELLAEINCSEQECAQLFNQTRQQWIERDLQSWLDQHRFYPGVIDRFRQAMKAGGPLFILTTKQERFADALLRGQGIEFPRDRLYGLDAGKKKEEILKELLTRPELKGAHWHFVEDRLATLQRVLDRPDLKLIRLYLAAWGYNTVQDRSYAQRSEVITLWNSEDFLVV